MSKQTNKSSRPEHDFRNQCEVYLHERWRAIEAGMASGAQIDDPLADRPDLIDAIRACLTSKTKSYH